MEGGKKYWEVHVGVCSTLGGSNGRKGEKMAVGICMKKIMWICMYLSQEI